MITNLKQRILCAVAAGHNNYRDIARNVGAPAHNLIWRHIHGDFTNGDLLQWREGRTGGNTLRLGPNAAVLRHNGRVVRVMRGERVN